MYVHNIIKPVRQLNSYYLKLIISSVLGIAIGTSWITRFRFYKFGISEFFFFIFTLFLFFLYKYELFKIKRNFFTFIKIFLFFLFFLIIPYKTININIYGASKVDLIIFFFSFFLFFLTFIALKKKVIDLNLVSIIFLVTFLTPLFFFLFVEDVVFKSKEFLNLDFLGLSNNPNQICFYLLCLLFFQSFLNKYFFFYFFLVLFFLSFYFKSSAFLLSSITIMISFLLLHLVNFFFKKKTAIIFFLFLMCLIIFILLNYNQTLTFAIKYFEGTETRILLLKNGILSILNSPFFGNGTGSFSGHQTFFEGYEIHNTFLDFASQFGIPFSLLVYGVMLISLYLMIINNNFLSAVSLLGLLVFLNFHYFGRHFVFYVILAILCNYIANYYKKFFLFKSKGNF